MRYTSSSIIMRLLLRLSLSLLIPIVNAFVPMNDGSNAKISVPVIGPIPTVGPLLVGSELALSNPTPLQIKALIGASVLPMRKVVDAAPIVAVIDEYSGALASIPNDPVRIPGGYAMTGRYATLAAVEGLKQKSDGSIDIENISGNCRLLGIGRCLITSFKNRIVEYDIEEAAAAAAAKAANVTLVDGDDACALESENGLDSSGAAVENDEIMVCDESITQVGGQEDDLEDPFNLYSTPIIIGEFSIINDMDTGSIVDSKGRKALCSPVHAMNALHTIVNKIERVHFMRQKIVSGLNAANILLEQAKVKNSHFESDEDLFKAVSGFDDLDFETSNDEEFDETVLTVNEFLSTVKGNSKRRDMSEIKEIPEEQKLKELENYGLSLYSSISSMNELTTETMERLEPFYSSAYREREAYVPEVLSFVAWRSVASIVDNSEIVAAVKCASTVERLEKVYEVMMNHKLLLDKLVKEINSELQEYGEECSDLW